tara:strand:- start:6348 stop:6881 length:534 start_codon:yes stop_codon:yes gene_type:complete
LTISRNDWIEAAWDVLGISGVDSLSIERLALQLGVTKGSFYWHFKSRQLLIDALLERWLGMREETCPSYSDESNQPGESIWKVIERGIERGTRGQAAALRLWGQNNPEVAIRIEKADALRQKFLVKQFLCLGHDQDTAENRAEIYMAVISAEFLHSGRLDINERLLNARRKHNMLVR